MSEEQKTTPDEDEEMPEFVPTRGELAVLMHFYGYEIVAYYWFEFATGNTDSPADPLLASWQARADAIGYLLGAEKVQEVKDNVYENVGRMKDPRLWHIFRNGDEGARAEVATEQAEQKYPALRDDAQKVVTAQSESPTQFLKLSNRLIKTGVPRA